MKTFEDLEFQYLEEETEWLAYREELHNDLKLLTKNINEKRNNLIRLRTQSIDNQNTACTDTKNIERNLWSLLNNMEKYREEIKLIDKTFFEITGLQYIQSDSDDDADLTKSVTNKNTTINNNIMSQSLFGSQEILSNSTSTKTKANQENLMSKSFNENLLFNTIEMPSIEDITTNINKQQQYSPHINQLTNNTPKKIDISKDITKISQDNHEHLKKAEQFDPLLKLKYNLSPPFEHKTLPLLKSSKHVDNDFNRVNSTEAGTADDKTSKNVNLNLSIESDDFEVNPLDKRMASQDDIDRISKITLDAPISMQGASDKVIESIKEIERNRQLLLSQQGKYNRYIIN